MSENDWSTWASVPWVGVTGADSNGGSQVIGWHKKRVPYVPDDHHHLSLQNLDVWIPAGDSDNQTQTPPESSEFPKRSGSWLIFIHGGAWRDPIVDSSCFSAAASHILRKLASESDGSAPIAGLASLNYRLSPYPDHPTDPSPPSDPGVPPDPARLAKHPDHIADVLTGIAFLQRLGAANGRYVLAGHSCGATLAFQAVMDPARWGLKEKTIGKPSVLLGVNGLYDLAGFIANPPAKFKDLRDAYEEFTRGAFGDDKAAWKAACPATASAWPHEWKDGTRVILVQSRGDSLVPYDQLEGMRAYLEAESSLHVEELEAGGEHDQIWEEGDRLAQLCSEAVSRLR
ncbi:Alpha/Beta hydrolase fold [Naviculisporaceae sp. PSN 640]